MTGWRGKAALAGSYLLVMATSAPAQWRGWSYAYYGPAYYGPAYYDATYYGAAYYGPAYYGPAYYVPAYYYAPAYPACATVVPAARPQPAPPSKKTPERVPAATNKEPPLMGDIQKKPPAITESRSLSGGSARSENSKRCQVGFWNLTGRDVTLTVDGQARLLAKDRALTLDLERSFAWQIDQRATVTEHVPAERDFHEVILRQ